MTVTELPAKNACGPYADGGSDVSTFVLTVQHGKLQLRWPLSWALLRLADATSLPFLEAAVLIRVGFRPCTSASLGILQPPFLGLPPPTATCLPGHRGVWLAPWSRVLEIPNCADALPHPGPPTEGQGG